MLPGLGRHLFSVTAAADTSAVTNFDDKPRLETDGITLPLRLDDYQVLHSFTLDLSNATTGTTLLAKADLWHRRLAHVNARSLDVLRKADGNAVSYNGEVSACDVCAIGKSTQRTHPKTAERNVNAPYQLVFTDLMEPITPVALGGYSYVGKFTEQHSKWKEIYLSKAKSDALTSLVLFQQEVVIPSGNRLQRLRTDKGGECTGDDYTAYCLQTGIRHAFASTNAPEQIGHQSAMVGLWRE